MATTQDGGRQSDILPIYFYCFLLLYALVWLVPRVGYMPPLLVSGVIYLISQTTYSVGWFGLGDRFIYFDIAAWQFLFMIFLFLGAHLREAQELIIKMPRSAYFSIVVALGLILAIGRVTNAYPTPFEGYEALHADWPRMQLHPIFLSKILVVVALFCAVLVRPDGLLALPNKAMRWCFFLPVLVNVVKFSIQMFTLHVFMMAIFNEISQYLQAPERYALALCFIFIFVAVPNQGVIRKMHRQKIRLSDQTAFSIPKSNG